MTGKLMDSEEAQVAISPAVNHPAHYGGDEPYETIKVLQAWLSPEAYSGFCLGNAVKYISRAGKKDPSKHIEYLEKARWYLDREITRLKAAVPAPAEPEPAGPFAVGDVVEIFGDHDGAKEALLWWGAAKSAHVVRVEGQQLEVELHERDRRHITHWRAERHLRKQTVPDVPTPRFELRVGDYVEYKEGGDGHPNFHSIFQITGIDSSGLVTMQTEKGFMAVSRKDALILVKRAAP